MDRPLQQVSVAHPASLTRARCPPARCIGTAVRTPHPFDKSKAAVRQIAHRTLGAAIVMIEALP